MPHFLGLDCGGTSTRALVINENEEVVFEGRGGPANIASTPITIVEDSLHTALEGSPVVDAAVGCFAGLLSFDSREVALDLTARISNAPTRVFPDYYAPLKAAKPGTDVVVISGTGSLVCSGGWRNGPVVKTGGGGYLLGDEGSAVDIGKRALKQLCLTNPEDEASDDFWAKARELYGNLDPQALVAAVYSVPPRELGKLAGVVANDAQAEFVYAKTVINAAFQDLAEQVHRHCFSNQIDRPIINLVLSGGLWDASPHFQETFERCLNCWNDKDQSDANSRQYHVEKLEAPPVLGAARLARLFSYGH